MAESRSISRWGAALGGLVLVLAGLELCTRLLAPQPLGVSGPTELLRGPLSSPGVHELRTPEFHVQVQVNSQGFVDHEWGPRRAGIPRVLVVGDSFIQGAQVPLAQGFGRVLAQELSQAHASEVEVLSMGVPGAGTATALDLVRAQGLALEPDVVLLGFLVSNDIMNNHPLLEGKADKPFYRLQDGELVRTDRHESLTQRWHTLPLWSHSHGVRWLVRRLLRHQETERQLDAGEGIPIPLRVHDPDAGPLWEASWAVTEAMLAAMARECASQGVQFGVVLIPDWAQSSPEGRRQMVAQWPEAESWNLSSSTSRIKALAAKYARVVDLQPALSMAGAGLYFPGDGHWTAAGHRAAAFGSVSLTQELLSAAD